jgi:hypothetical protein
MQKQPRSTVLPSTLTAHSFHFKSEVIVLAQSLFQISMPSLRYKIFGVIFNQNN